MQCTLNITIMRIHLSSTTNDVLWLIADADAAAEQLPTLLVTDDNAVKSMCIAAGASCSPHSSSNASHHCNSALSRCRHPSCPRQTRPLPTYSLLPPHCTPRHQLMCAAGMKQPSWPFGRWRERCCVRACSFCARLRWFANTCATTNPHPNAATASCAPKETPSWSRCECICSLVARIPHLLNHACPPLYFDFRSPITRRDPLSLRRFASPYPPRRKKLSLIRGICLCA